MQSDPQDEQWTLPESRDGAPRDPVGAEQGTSSSESSDALPPPEMPPPAATPPRMPAPPQMPSASPPPSAWGGAPPAMPGDMPAPPVVDETHHGGPREPAGTEAGEALEAPAPTAHEPPAEVAEATSAVAEEMAAAAEEKAPAKGVVRPGPKAGVAPVVQGDWLASVCPYLTSEDGTYRSAAPNEGHRCTAQDPAATLPLAFQERFCLTDRHPRCEMYKFAQETDSSGGIPVAAVPPTDPPTPKTGSAGAGGGPRGPWAATLAGIGGLVVVVALVIFFMGSCGSGEDGSVSNPDLAPDGQATAAPASTPTPRPAATAGSADGPDSTQAAGPDETAWILYEIQPGEALLRVSETFGVTRNRIRRENPELEGVASADLPGTVIVLPITGDMTLAEAEALPGYVGPLTDAEPEAEG